MTHVEAVEIVALLTAAFATPTWAEETIRLYADMLIDLDRDCVREVVSDVIRSRKTDRAPTIGEIRQEVAQRQWEGAGLGLLTPDDAWGFVLRSITQVGHVGPFPRRYPLVTRIVDRLGWQNLCQSTNQPADRARFLEMYRDLRDRSLSVAAASRGAVPHVPVDDLRGPKQTSVVGPTNRADVSDLVRNPCARIEGKWLGHSPRAPATPANAADDAACGAVTSIRGEQ